MEDLRRLAGQTKRHENTCVVRPDDIQLIGNEVAIRWSDGVESFLAAPALRAASPSAAAKGEADIFGRVHGGEKPRDFSDVTVVAWYPIGNYAIRFAFSDGHQTGLYSYELLRSLGAGDQQA
jgi:DUF971 family protein